MKPEGSELGISSYTVRDKYPGIDFSKSEQETLVRHISLALNTQKDKDRDDKA